MNGEQNKCAEPVVLPNRIRKDFMKDLGANAERA
jgi:hypothetical protein